MSKVQRTITADQRQRACAAVRLALYDVLPAYLADLLGSLLIAMDVASCAAEAAGGLDAERLPDGIGQAYRAAAFAVREFDRRLDYFVGEQLEELAAQYPDDPYIAGIAAALFAPPAA